MRSSYSSHCPPTQRTSSSGSLPGSACLKTDEYMARSRDHLVSGLSSCQDYTNSFTCPGSLAHVSFVSRKRRVTLHMHPLLAASQLSRAPISYNVSHLPSPHTVVDQINQSAIPAHTLSQPATDPPTLSQLVLRSHKFPWPVIVNAGCSSQQKTVSKIYLGETSPTRSSIFPALTPVLCSDVPHEVHGTLLQAATPEEWDALGCGSHAQRKISRAYGRRCRSSGGGWDGGIRRVDWLGEKTRLIGVEVDKVSGSKVGNLVFGKA